MAVAAGCWPCHTTTLTGGSRSIGNVFAKIDGMQNPMTFLLFMKNGLIDTLEGAAIDEGTANIDFSIARFEIVKLTEAHWRRVGNGAVNIC